MILRFRVLFIFAFIASFTAFVGAASAAVTKTQQPCIAGGIYCVLIQDTGTIPVIRHLTFTAPSAGTATVIFHGSMSCHNDGNVSGEGVIELHSQIIDTTDQAIRNGPGGLTHLMRLAPTTATSGSYIAAVNLNSTRVFSVTPGNHTYRFRITRSRMDPNTLCYVYNAAFTVQFIP